MRFQRSQVACRRGAGWLLLATCAAGIAFADGNIDSTDKYAWSENVGWHNWNDSNGGGVTVNVSGGYLSGYVWAENVGWIKLGADAGGPYANMAADNYGVNMDGGGKLSGYAWSETCSWINFHPSHSQVTIDKATGSFDGYAWAENIGWVHFRSAVVPVYSVRTTASFAAGTLILIR